MNRKLLSSALILAFALASGLVFGGPAAAKPKKPSLNVRVSPRLAFSPVSVIATAELKGGDDSEDFYCLAIEWDWDDGSKSVRNSDCDPYEPGTKIVRRFSSSHHYSRAGSYNIRASLKASEKTIARKGVRLQIREGLPTDPRGRGGR